MKVFSKAYSDMGHPELYTPAQRVVGEMGKAMWHFAQLKEITWYQWGYQGISDAIHGLEHDYGDYIDEFKSVMAQLGLPLIYPDVEAITESFESIERIFDVCITDLENVNMALSNFISYTDNAGLEPLARKAEEIQMRNFRPKAWLMQTKTMAENGESAASLDKWFIRFFSKGEADAYED